MVEFTVVDVAVVSEIRMTISCPASSMQDKICAGDFRVGMDFRVVLGAARCFRQVCFFLFFLPSVLSSSSPSSASLSCLRIWSLLLIRR